MNQIREQQFTAVCSASPSIGIVIPTYNRVVDLLKCLRHLEAQTWTDFEVLVVDDGSEDSTSKEVEIYRRTAKFPLRYLRQPNRGPATARNLAIAHLNAPICIFIGDDIFPTPDFVRAHLEFHQAHPQLTVAALGLTRWSEEGQTVTPYMRWLDQDGVQFAYGELLNGLSPTWMHFYTSNLSLKTALLREHPFHEGFRRAAMEDIELGYRLMVKHDLAISFLPEAVAYHLHPTNFQRSCHRMVHVGEAVHLFEELWPEQHIQRGPLKRFLIACLTEKVVILPTLRLSADLLHRVWCPNPLLRMVLSLHRHLGYKQADAKGKKQHS